MPDNASSPQTDSSTNKCTCTHDCIGTNDGRTLDVRSALHFRTTVNGKVIDNRIAGGQGLETSDTNSGARLVARQAGSSKCANRDSDHSARMCYCLWKATTLGTRKDVNRTATTDRWLFSSHPPLILLTTPIAGTFLSPFSGTETLYIFCTYFR